LQGTLETMKGEIESLRSKLKSEQINASKAVSDSDTIKLLQEEKVSALVVSTCALLSSP
jgi:hypothetical protein